MRAEPRQSFWQAGSMSAPWSCLPLKHFISRTLDQMQQGKCWALLVVKRNLLRLLWFLIVPLCLDSLYYCGEGGGVFLSACLQSWQILLLLQDLPTVWDLLEMISSLVGRTGNGPFWIFLGKGFRSTLLRIVRHRQVHFRLPVILQTPVTCFPGKS